MTGRTRADGVLCAEAAGPVDELERRLAEQVSANAELDAEVRYLQAELAIREEYLKSLEAEVEQTGAEIGQLHLALTEHLAYRRRVSHRAVDQAVATVRRSPALYGHPDHGRPGRSATRSRPAGGASVSAALRARTLHPLPAPPTRAPPKSGSRADLYRPEAYYDEYGPRDEAGLLPCPRPIDGVIPHWEEFFGSVADKIAEQLARASGPRRRVRHRLPHRGAAHAAAWTPTVLDVSRNGRSTRCPRSSGPTSTVAPLTEELAGRYDLITCLEVLEHLTPTDALPAAANLCRHTDTILFSSSPDDVTRADPPQRPAHRLLGRTSSPGTDSSGTCATTPPTSRPTPSCSRRRAWGLSRSWPPSTTAGLVADAPDGAGGPRRPATAWPARRSEPPSGSPC